MPSRKKKFIDKKNAVTFTVVHRSQKDPKAADEEAPQRVLLSSQREEQLKYGIEFDDEYNYLQHLKDVKELCNVKAETFRIGKPSSEPRLLLPSVVFASDVETTVGLLNKNIPLIGPQPDLDPEILAALDGEVKSDDELDDDFVSFANAINNEDDNDDETMSDANDDVSSDDAMGSQNKSEDDDDKRSRFTGYSMTSSIIRRNANLQLIDAKFEKFYEKFKNDEIEDTDVENVDSDSDVKFEGAQNSDRLYQLVNQYQQKENSRAIEMREFVEKTNRLNVGDNVNDNGLVPEAGSDSTETSDEEMERIEVEVPDHSWDCESIISTYSTTKNQPQIVYLSSKKPIKPISRHQIADDVIPASKKDDAVDKENQQKLIHQTIRSRNETKKKKVPTATLR